MTTRDNKCPPPRALPGLDNTTCAATCGPLSTGCLSALFKACAADKAKGGVADCDSAGTHQTQLKAAGCTTTKVGRLAEFKAFCAGPQ